MIKEMLYILAEILHINSNNIEFTEEVYEGHYVRTPYAFQPKFGRKYIPELHIDLGQGLLNLIEEITNNQK